MVVTFNRGKRKGLFYLDSVGVPFDYASKITFRKPLLLPVNIMWPEVSALWKSLSSFTWKPSSIRAKRCFIWAYSQCIFPTISVTDVDCSVKALFWFFGRIFLSKCRHIAAERQSLRCWHRLYSHPPSWLICGWRIKIKLFLPGTGASAGQDNLLFYAIFRDFFCFWKGDH